MSRRLNKEKENLINYIDQYNLKRLLGDESLTKSLESCLKYNKSLLYLANILEEKTYSRPERIVEVASDAQTCIFLAIHGAYKPASAMLRSCIENIIKYMLERWGGNDEITKSLYETIENLKTHKEYTDNINEWSIILQIYGELCEDVHTANARNMAKIGSLNSFPIANKEFSKKYISLYKKTMSVILYILIYQEREVVIKRHHRDIDVILEPMTKSQNKILKISPT